MNQSTAPERAEQIAAPQGLVSPRRGDPTNLFTPRSVSLGGGILIILLLAIRIAPNISYRLHLPIGVFYLLLIGGTALAFVVRRRWARYLPPSEAKPNYDRMETGEARRTAFLTLGRFAFRVIPVLAAIAFVAWFGIFHTSSFWGYGIVFAITWNVVAASVYNALVVPRFRPR